MHPRLRETFFGNAIKNFDGAPTPPLFERSDGARRYGRGPHKARSPNERNWPSQGVHRVHGTVAALHVIHAPLLCLVRRPYSFPRSRLCPLPQRNIQLLPVATDAFVSFHACGHTTSRGGLRTEKSA